MWIFRFNDSDNNEPRIAMSRSKTRLFEYAKKHIQRVRNSVEKRQVPPIQLKLVKTGHNEYAIQDGWKDVWGWIFMERLKQV